MLHDYAEIANISITFLYLENSLKKMTTSIRKKIMDIKKRAKGFKEQMASGHKLLEKNHENFNMYFNIIIL